MSNALIILGVVLFVIIIAAVFYFIIKSSKKPILAPTTKTSKKGEPTLDDLIYLAKTTESKTTLNNVVMLFLKTQSLESKTSVVLSEDAKKKLGFISAVCANKLSDAKLISFLNLELEKKYPSYKREIDLYENMGLAKRKMQA